MMGVQEGMPVYDPDNEKLGKVAEVRYPEGTTDVALAEVLFVGTPLNAAPRVVRTRLAETGYMQVSTGLFQRDYYVRLDQIKRVSDQGVILNVYSDDLFQL